MFIPQIHTGHALRVHFLPLICLFVYLGAEFALAGTCPPFFLKDDAGQIINPLTSENQFKAYSTRKTCGECHDYDLISNGYHFQQGWDRIRDDFDADNPWVLSDGMMGKH